jgi:hypothetical protein
MRPLPLEEVAKTEIRVEEGVVGGREVDENVEGSNTNYWRKSSRSYGSGQCVQVAAPSGRHINVRDSKNTDGAVLSFSSTEWNVFVTDVRCGNFGV